MEFTFGMVAKKSQQKIVGEFVLYNLQSYIFFSEAEIVARDLISRGCQNVLLTLGPQGALYLPSGNEKHIFKSNSPEVTCVDSTGAGDAFIGALAYFLANKTIISIEKAIEAACIVAADSVTRLGTQISFPGTEVLKRIKDF